MEQVHNVENLIKWLRNEHQIYITIDFIECSVLRFIYKIRKIKKLNPENSNSDLIEFEYNSVSLFTYTDYYKCLNDAIKEATNLINIKLPFENFETSENDSLIKSQTTKKIVVVNWSEKSSKDNKTMICSEIEITIDDLMSPLETYSAILEKLFKNQNIDDIVIHSFIMS